MQLCRTPQQTVGPADRRSHRVAPGTVIVLPTAVYHQDNMRQSHSSKPGIQNPDIRTLPCPSVPNGASSRLSVLIWSAIALAAPPRPYSEIKRHCADIIANDGFAVFFADELLTELAQSTF